MGLPMQGMQSDNFSLLELNSLSWGSVSSSLERCRAVQSENMTHFPLLSHFLTFCSLILTVFSPVWNLKWTLFFLCLLQFTHQTPWATARSNSDKAVLMIQKFCNSYKIHACSVLLLISFTSRPCLCTCSQRVFPPYWAVRFLLWLLVYVRI